MLLDNEIYCRQATILSPVHVGHYPNNEPLVRWGAYGSISRICVRPRSLETLVAALFWVDALVERGHPVPELVLPCLPGARQDRLNSQGDYLFTAKSIAQMINARNFPRVITVDPHSEVMPGLINHCEVIPSVAVFAMPYVRLRPYDAVIAPDAGAAKRAFEVAQFLKIPMYQGWKKRSTADGSLSGFGIEPFTVDPGAALLIVDDLCDGGGTFNGLADLLPSEAQLDLFVTHGIFSKGFNELLQCYTNIITTDSFISGQVGRHSRIAICQDLLEKGHL